VLVWQKRISAKLEDDWRERLGWLEPHRLVVVRLATADETRRLEIYDITTPEAERLTGQFGGQVKSIDPEAWFFSSGPDQMPLRIRDKLLVVNHPEALDRARAQFPERKVLLVPPGMAFGTGEHATTITCLRYLVDVSRKLPRSRWSLLDAGTGSGIISLAAEKLGAGRVQGFDNHPDSIRVATENAKINKCTLPRFEEGDVLARLPGDDPWDVITANIYSDILIQALPNLTGKLAAPGHLILSGILTKDAGGVKSAAEAQGVHLLKERAIGKWTSLLYGRG
jgi:ribosomal protein L11 methyltransferase